MFDPTQKARAKRAIRCDWECATTPLMAVPIRCSHKREDGSATALDAEVAQLATLSGTPIPADRLLDRKKAEREFDKSTSLTDSASGQLTQPAARSRSALIILGTSRDVVYKHASRHKRAEELSTVFVISSNGTSLSV